MMKKILACLLAVLMLVSFAACSKKNGTDNGDDNDSYKVEEIVLDYVRLESKDAAGAVQKDATGNVIYDVFKFDDIDSDSVRIISYHAETIGSQNTKDDKTIVSYVNCYEPHVVVIPAEINGKEVAEIGDTAFYAKSEIKSVVIPASVTAIRDYAFAKCSLLPEIVLPASLNVLGEGAFKDCVAAASITFPSAGTLVEIADFSFSGCTALTALTVPGSVKTVGMGAFYGCKAITTLTVSEGVVTIGDQAFQNLEALVSVSLPASLADTTVPGNNGSVTIPAIGALNFVGCPDLLSSGVTVGDSQPAKDYIASLWD